MRLRRVENLLGNNQQAGTVGCPGECAEPISWPQAGYYKAEDGDENRMAGEAWRLKFMRLPGLEASINYRQEQYGNERATVRSWPGMLAGPIYPVPIAYGAVGAGWYNTTYDHDQNKYPARAPEDATTQECGWHFGGGIEVPAGSRFKLAGDVRYVFLHYDFKDIPGDADLKSTFYAITIGLLLGL